MMKKEYDTLVLIGRFQGPHKAHFELLEKAGKLANQVLIIIGSAYAPRSPKNPWTVEERTEMLEPELKRLANFTQSVYTLDYNIDTRYDDDGWVARTQAIVQTHTKEGDRIALIGYKKDPETKAYLEMFPQWEYVDSNPVEVLSATDIRNLYFSDKFAPSWLAGVTPPSVISFLDKFRGTPEYQNILEEKKVVDVYRARAAVYPYPIVAVTCDAVVVQSGHILLIKRRAHPGRGLWALPGGYFDAASDNAPLDGIIRELKEETCIDVPEKVLRGCVKQIKDFSAKGRSQLGRSITFAAHIGLSGGEWKLPKVKGTDDAEKAKWVPFVDVKRELLFDDHYDIITHFVPLIK
jgi:bifunctional NMN adenylyltransferase/nudix hydrolase